MRNKLVNSVLDAEREGRLWATAIVIAFFLAVSFFTAFLTFFVLLAVWETLT